MSVLKKCALMFAVTAAFFSGNAQHLIGSVAKAAEQGKESGKSDKADKGSRPDKGTAKEGSGGTCT